MRLAVIILLLAAYVVVLPVVMTFCYRLGIWLGCRLRADRW